MKCSVGLRSTYRGFLQHFFGGKRVGHSRAQRPARDGPNGQPVMGLTSCMQWAKSRLGLGLGVFGSNHGPRPNHGLNALGSSLDHGLGSLGPALIHVTCWADMTHNSAVLSRAEPIIITRWAGLGRPWMAWLN